ICSCDCSAHQSLPCFSFQHSADPLYLPPFPTRRSSDLYVIGDQFTGQPMQLPVVDIVEVGAGGGSLAWCDAGERAAAGVAPGERSEEHTSELQSLTNLVCRLLLEKKKRQHHTIV